MEQIKILIVDDEENIRNVIKEYAKVENYLTKEASDGKEALELIKNEPFDFNGFRYNDAQDGWLNFIKLYS